MATSPGADQAVWAFVENEHRDLVRGINRIHEVACEVGLRATPDLSLNVLEVLRWFDNCLEPHLAWEEAWLYPEIDRLTGTPWATRAARFDHQQVREVAAGLRVRHRELGQHSSTHPEADIRCQMFGLEALLRAHIQREERFLIPILSEDRWVGSRETADSSGAASSLPLHPA